MWSASLQIQSLKLLNASISRLHLEVELDRKITKISEVLSKNAMVWFNHACVQGLCTVPGHAWSQGWYEQDALMIERWASDSMVIFRIHANAQVHGVVAHRQCIVSCLKAGCRVQACRKG